MFNILGLFILEIYISKERKGKPPLKDAKVKPIKNINIEMYGFLYGIIEIYLYGSCCF